MFRTKNTQYFQEVNTILLIGVYSLNTIPNNMTTKLQKQNSQASVQNDLQETPSHQT